MIPETIKRIGELLRTQHNSYTANPVFCVQTLRRRYGFDPDYCSDVVWLYDDHGEVEDPEEIDRLNEAYEAGDDIDNCYRTGYEDSRETVAVFLTRDAAEEYIRANGHRLHDPIVWVDSAYRNYEWQDVVAFLASLPAPGKPTPEEVRIAELECQVQSLKNDLNAARTVFDSLTLDVR